MLSLLTCNLLYSFSIVIIWLVDSSCQHHSPQNSSCPSLLPPPNGIVIGNIAGACGTSVGSVCRIECQNNCQMMGDSFHTCLPNNVWSGRPTQCVDKSIRCRPRLDSPQNGFQVGRCRNWGGYVCTFACNPGYTLYGSSRIVCRRRGKQWSASVPTCSQNTNNTTTDNPQDPQSSNFCPTLPVPSNGIQSGICNCNSAIPGSSCAFSCNHGFRLFGDPVLICLSNGSWSDLVPTCRRSVVNCPTLSPPLNGFYFGNCSPGQQHSNCHFRCNPGFFLIGSPHLKCLHGLWSAPPPICSRANAGCSLPSPPFGSTITSCNTVISGQCNYRCKRGYHAYNSNLGMYSICSDNGLWEWPQTPICRPVIHSFFWFWGRNYPFDWIS